MPRAVIGLDLGVCLNICEALGYAAAALAELLPAAEAGLVEGLNRRLADQLPETPSDH